MAALACCAASRSPRKAPHWASRRSTSHWAAVHCKAEGVGGEGPGPGSGLWHLKQPQAPAATMPSSMTGIRRQKHPPCAAAWLARAGPEAHRRWPVRRGRASGLDHNPLTQRPVFPFRVEYTLRIFAHVCAYFVHNIHIIPVVPSFRRSTFRLFSRSIEMSLVPS